jgi:hypothetical protein
LSDQSGFELPPLIACERAVLQTLFCRLTVDGKDTFTSDTIREMGLDKILYGDLDKELGLLCLKAKLFGLTVDTGRRVPSSWPSNHGREIKVYQIVKGV